MFSASVIAPIVPRNRDAAPPRQPHVVAVEKVTPEWTFQSTIQQSNRLPCGKVCGTAILDLFARLVAAAVPHIDHSRIHNGGLRPT